MLYMILKIVNLCKSPNKKFISKKYFPTYKTHKVYFLGKKFNKSSISGYSAPHVFWIYIGRRGASQGLILDIKLATEYGSPVLLVEEQCGRESNISNSCVAGFITSGICRKSKESVAQREKRVMAPRTAWAQRR